MKEKLKGVYNVGVNDKKIDLFEGMYNVPNGITYNSYVAVDEKIAVFDTVDARFGKEWLENIDRILDGRQPDYLVVLHMEPDHSANILEFIKKYPEVKVVGNSKTFVMIKEFFGEDFDFSTVEVKDGDKLSLGEREIHFVFAPMVHWPEVMLAYDSFDKIIFSADAFGKFGSDDCGEYWLDEARRYYFGIVGKFGVQVQNVLKKLSALDVEKIYPLHGPVLDSNLGYYIGKYDTWSKYDVEVKGVLIAYSSVYGHTARVANELAGMLLKLGVKEVEAVDLCRTDWAECVAKAFKNSATVLATTTYNGDIFPTMREFLDKLKERNFQNRIVGLIENGSWAPVAAKAMQKRLDGCKNLRFCEAQVKIRSALNAESRAQLSALADELASFVENNV